MSARRVCALALVAVLLGAATARAALSSGEVHVWETQEIALESARAYANPYVEVDVLDRPRGAGILATCRTGSGTASAASGSASSRRRRASGASRPARTSRATRGSTAEAAGSGRWRGPRPRRRRTRTGADSCGPPRTGTPSQYADGTPFFLVGDTWLAASTWRLPLAGRAAGAPEYEPASGIGFEEAVAYRKRQGFNSISLIAAFPNWDADHRGATFANADGVYLRNAWEKFGHWAKDARISTSDGALTTAKDMADEQRNQPFAVLEDARRPRRLRAAEPRVLPQPRPQDAPPRRRGLRALPRDGAPGLHAVVEGLLRLRGVVRPLRPVPRRAIRGPEPRLQRHPPGLDPEGLQPDRRRVRRGADPLAREVRRPALRPAGHDAASTARPTRPSATAQRCPWLTMHTVGNKPRNHAIYASLEEIFRLSPPYPAANLEPYYTGLEPRDQPARRRAAGAPTPTATTTSRAPRRTAPCCRGAWPATCTGPRPTT